MAPRRFDAEHFCRPSGGKRRYSTKKEARRAILLIWQHEPRKNMWFYRCPFCKRFHLTSKGTLRGSEK